MVTAYAAESEILFSASDQSCPRHLRSSNLPGSYHHLMSLPLVLACFRAKHRKRNFARNCSCLSCAGNDAQIQSDTAIT
jgi:hypothetical protein